MATLILAEHDHASLKPATLQTVYAAQQLGEPCHVIVLGHNARPAAVAASFLQGVEKVILINNSAFEHPTAEPLTEALLTLKENYKAFVAPATAWGKNIMPRLAALLDVMQISDVIEIKSPNTFVRPIYAGNALLTLKTSDPLKVLTIRATAFEHAQTKGEPCPIDEKSVSLMQQTLCKFVSREENKSHRPELTAARIVIAGGRGLQSAENFKLIETLADTMNAAVGASRAAVDAGYVPNDYQVGQTGKVVSPHLYIAVGISGAIQHLAGMKDSKLIVAINKDEEAPIFQIADYGLVGDLFEILPQLTQEINRLKGREA